MKRITLGEGVTVDLDVLVNTRLLIQANSGGGKSWCLRRLLEQTHGRIQHLVIDPEGEFASLREKFDYVLAAKRDGDTLADPRSAALLAHRLLELGVSAILDIFELRPDERKRFVKLFLDALVDAPKTLWHPVLVVLDEAHVYASEKNPVESADAVKSLATRGRKRGFCLVAATQRLAKLDKDVAAECGCKLIGRTTLDVDMKRAADELGFTTKDDKLSLRDLAPGEFFAYGPAFATGVTRARIGTIQTQHPKAGSKLAAVVPPPTDRVRAVLAKLGDLPKEAEKKAATEADLRAEITRLKGKLTKPVTHTVVTKEISVLTPADRELVQKFTTQLLNMSDACTALFSMVTGLTQKLTPVTVSPARPVPTPRVVPPRANIRIAPPAPTSNGHLPNTQTRILDMIATLQARGLPPNKDMLARWLGLHPNGGRYNRDLAALRAEGYVDGCVLTADGARIAGPLKTGYDALLATVSSTQQRILETLYAHVLERPTGLSKDELAAALNLHPNGGRFNRDLSWLRTMGVITERGPIKLTGEAEA